MVLISQLLNYGFATKIERELFRNLISVSGVGGNTARMILSTYSSSELRNIIATENAVLLKNVKGLGLKTAQKIIVELSGKMLELGADKAEVVQVAQAKPAAYDETSEREIHRLQGFPVERRMEGSFRVVRTNGWSIFRYADSSQSEQKGRTQ